MRYLDRCASSVLGSSVVRRRAWSLVSYCASLILDRYERRSQLHSRGEHSLELQVPQLVAPPAEPPRHAAQVQRVERGHLMGRQLKGDRNIGSDA